MNENLFKTSVAAAVAAIAAYFKIVGMPILVLLCFMIADYITGMTAAYMKGELSSKTGFRGVIKKLCYMFAVVAGIGIDYVCDSALSRVGIPSEVCFFGLLVTVWLILNEIISILENLDRIGVPTPGFLRNITKRLRRSVENKGGDSANHNGEDDTEKK